MQDEDKRQLIEAEYGQSQSFDKAILTLSSGAFVLSITFVRDVGPACKAPLLLFGAWVAFTCAIVCTAASFLASQKALRAHRTVIMGGIGRELAKKLEGRVGRMNEISLKLFTLGMVLLVLFGGANLFMKGDAMQMSDKESKFSLEEGFVPPEMPGKIEGDKDRGFVPPELPAERAPIPEQPTEPTPAPEGKPE